MAHVYKRKNSKYLWLQWYDSEFRQNRRASTKRLGTPCEDTKTGWREAKKLGKKIEASKTLKTELRHYQDIPATSIYLSSALKLFFKKKNSRQNSRISKKSEINYSLAVNHLISAVGDKPIGDYNEYDCETFEKYMANINHSLHTQAIYTRTLKAFFNFFIQKQWIKNQPIYSIKAPKKKPRKIPSEDMSKIFEHLYVKFPHVYNFTIFLLLTGLRANEALVVEWSDINFDENFIEIDNTKAKRHEEEIILTDELKNMLMQIKPAQSEGRIFSYYKNYEGIKSAWQRTMKALQVSYTIHQFRKTFASYLLDCGMSPYDVFKLLRHTDVKVMLEHYVESDKKRIRNELNAKVKFFGGFLPDQIKKSVSENVSQISSEKERSAVIFNINSL